MLCGIFDFGDAVGAAEVNFRRQTRRLEQEALQRRNAGKAQQPVLVHGFNAFGGSLDVEAAREAMLTFVTTPTGAYYPTGIERADNIGKAAAAQE